MTETLPVIEITHKLGLSINAELSLCYTCGTCAAECPVNRATGLLQPQKYVRAASLGVLDEFIASPEIWYCLGCNRCSNNCPMTVKPSVLLDFMRREAVRRGLAPAGTGRRIREMQMLLGRVRWNLARHCMNGGSDIDMQSAWSALSEKPVAVQPAPIESRNGGAKEFRKSFGGYMGSLTNINSCFTCCECTNSCPVFREAGLFDPMRILRSIAFGLRDELLGSPSIWLCLGCGSCTQACGQDVKGHLVLRRARELAVEGGFVSAGFPDRWRLAEKPAYREYAQRVDTLLRGGAA